MLQLHFELSYLIMHFLSTIDLDNSHKEKIKNLPHLVNDSTTLTKHPISKEVLIPHSLNKCGNE